MTNYLNMFDRSKDDWENYASIYFVTYSMMKYGNIEKFQKEIGEIYYQIQPASFLEFAKMSKWKKIPTKKNLEDLCVFVEKMADENYLEYLKDTH